jgi:hypothetical protein
MTFQTVAETTLHVSAAAPATYDAAGFAALTWTAVGELTDIGSVKGRSYNVSTHAPVGSAQQTQKKGSYTLPNADFSCAWDEDDAGQIIIDTGSKTNDTYSFKLTKQDGSIRYFTAPIMSFVENNGTVDDVVNGAFTLLRQTDSVSVAAP